MYIHSQLKSPSSSEIASIIEGVIHDCTEIEVIVSMSIRMAKAIVAFAFCRLLGFQSLP
ncbi:Tn3 family transposase [Xylella taiwanensis]|uniref:Tn3 family transposase n=1 Tax=Xylella taiwanensis TaxID=1444770 RepID=UPI003CCCA80A